MLLLIAINLNIISKANALNIIPSTNNSDEQDYLQRYEKFYEDESFREAYYNYHKKHHQQEQQQQLSHNDYYNYETDHHYTPKYYAKDINNDIGIPFSYDEDNNYDELKYSSNYESQYTEYTNEYNNYNR
jgi:hypothetical protein